MSDRVMPGEVPRHPKIYHIVHVDRLHSILEKGYLLNDSEVTRRGIAGTTIGDLGIKNRRQRKPLRTYPDTKIGDYVPFYFCPRSVLLYKNYQAGRGSNTGQSEPANRAGEDEIIHLEADLVKVVRSANANKVPWLFTDVNAANEIAQEFNCLSQLHRLDWNVIGSRYWRGKHDLKMAEFLVVDRFPTHLIDRIGVRLESVQSKVSTILEQFECRIPIQVVKTWYYGV